MAKQSDETGSSEPLSGRTLPQALTPQLTVLLLAEYGPNEISSDRLTALDIGCKALGLSTLPSRWSLPYFVISAKCFESHISRSDLNNWLSSCILRTRFSDTTPLIIRSSGAAETINDRGSYVSKRCALPEIIPTIEQLRAELPERTRQHVHWIVQEAIKAQRSGHFSNERRVSREPRDWVIEFESSAEYRGYAVSIAIRTWREGRTVVFSDLKCGSDNQIIQRLRQVAKWGSRFSSRLHFEWVCDGHKLWVVQADAEGSTSGVDPLSSLPTAVPQINIGSLRIFRLAAAADYDKYIKLQNAAFYCTLGYNMPPFFIADDPEIISRILKGDVFDELEKDLIDLIRRPLIIRTDGANIPDEKRNMLPRSDPLGSATEGKEWLLGHFRNEILKAEIANAQICLIAHHFIPSVASAWARAEPQNRLVRIEALWGIPEGLYWYSHDTFEIDTLDVALPKLTSPRNYGYKISEKRLRYKGTFVSADENGRWAATKVLAPFDWRSSIKRQDWLFEIAYVTRRVAEAKGFPVAVMWFIDNHPAATQHTVLPWYHFKSELVIPLHAGPRRKLSCTGDFTIKNASDWEKLQRKLVSGLRVERVVVEPADAELIRNPTFAEALGKLGAAKRFVIELSGGILSHAYYILTRVGAQVECIDLFGADEERAEFNKIVRDKIPEIIAKRGERTEVARLEGEALIMALRQKLVEEAFEALDARSDHDLVGELADVGEVISALCNALKLSGAHLTTVQKQKRLKRGGFEKGVMLARTITPHSIHQTMPVSSEPDLKLQMDTLEAPVISHSTELPTKPFYRRPDLRQIDQQPEKLFTFATEVNKLDGLRATLHFSMPVGAGHERQFALTVELQRSGITLRGKIRVRRLPSQLPFDFADQEEDPDTNQ